MKNFLCIIHEKSAIMAQNGRLEVVSLMNYPHLMSPIRIGSLTAKNRIESPPTSFMDGTTEGFLNDTAIEMYRARAKGGAAIVTLGEAYIDDERGIPHPSGLSLYNKNVLPYLIRATEAIRQFGSIPSVELLHPGMRVDVSLNRGGRAYGPSAVENIFAYDHPVYELTEEMILDIIRRYGDAAELAQDGGVRMVMIYAAHGWLVSQFLSPLTNRRTDAWGGSLENRCRLPVMIAQEIKRRCGRDFVVEFRLSAAEHIPGGYTIEDTIALCRMLEGSVDLINVSNGSFASRESAKLTIGSSVFMPHGHNVEEAAQIKAAINIPVAVVGGLGDAEQMEELIRTGKADMVSLARALIADPELPNKLERGRAEDVCPCIRCNYCFSHNYIPLTPYPKKLPRCAVNPRFGRDELYGNARRESFLPRSRVLIAGGGPAGMQAALTAAELGHAVTLYEREPQLGGLLRFAAHPAFKDDLALFRDRLIRRVENEPRIDLRLGEALTPEKAAELAPDLLVAAVGSEVTSLPLPGIDLPHVYSLTRLAEEDPELGDSVVVIGGGLSGCEEALDLAQHGKHVVIVEALDAVLSTLNYDYYLHKKDLVDAMAAQPELHILCGAKVKEITDRAVLITDAEGAERALPASGVVVACGNRARTDAVDAFRAAGLRCIAAGDCVSARNVCAALEEGFLAVLDI